MDTTRHRGARAGESSSPENRAETTADGALEGSGGGPSVTAVRSGGVVRPSFGGLIYEADPSRHLIVARHGDGPVAFAFGGYGRGPGQFRTPLHVIAVSSVFSGRCGSRRDAGAHGRTPWLAVADYGNHRIQFFEGDGAYLGDTELAPTQPPCHLDWSAPVLLVTTVDGRNVRVRPTPTLLSSSGSDQRHTWRVPVDLRRAWRVC